MTAQSRITAGKPAAKEDLYYAIHKAIRLASARMLVRLGNTDPADEPALMQTLGALQAHLDLSLSHLKHENHAIHSAIEARVPGGSAHAGEDHDHHLQSFEELRRLSREVAKAGPMDRAGKLRRLYQRFALFMADDLIHMNEEETELQPLIEAHFSAEEITGIHDAIVANIPPAEMTGSLRLMLGAANRTERVGMITGMNTGMPPEAFTGLMTEIVGKPWKMGDWEELERAVC